MRLFRERIDGLADPLDPGFGYDLIRIDVALAERIDASQLKLEGGHHQATGEDAVAALIDRLSTRLGRGCDPAVRAAREPYPRTGRTAAARDADRRRHDRVARARDAANRRCARSICSIRRSRSTC